MTFSSHRVGPIPLSVLAFGLCARVLTGQTATVATEDAAVVVQGDYVRIGTSEGATEVRGDWRESARGHVGDSETLLVELGAVRGPDHLRLSLGADVLFDFGSAAVTDAAATTLARVAQVVRDHARGEVLVVGHTDSIGDDQANQKLSEARAAAVLSWLHRSQGIPAGILVGRGMGERQPVAHETTPDGRDEPAGRARNRRVEIFVGTVPEADVRVAAGLVTVASPAGEVRIDEDQVDVGGLVAVAESGVRISGAAAAGAAARGGGETTCAAGKICSADCPQGSCRMTCPAGANCNYDCRGGGCEMNCAAGARCDFSCAGGNCRFSSALGSNCATSCAGGGCSGG